MEKNLVKLSQASQTKFHFVGAASEEMQEPIRCYQFPFDVYSFATLQRKFFVRSLDRLVVALTRICALTKPQLSDKSNPKFCSSEASRTSRPTADRLASAKLYSSANSIKTLFRLVSCSIASSFVNAPNWLCYFSLSTIIHSRFFCETSRFNEACT